MNKESSIIDLLHQAQNDPDAENELYRRIEDRLRDIARGQLAWEWRDHSLQTTLLMDDAFMLLFPRNMKSRGSPYEWRNSNQLFAAAAKVMRRILVDNARKHLAQKRNRGQKPQPFIESDVQVGSLVDPQEAVATDEIIRKLEKNKPDLFVVFDLKYFGGCTLKEISKILKISYDTAKVRWQLARAYLVRELEKDGCNGG